MKLSNNFRTIYIKWFQFAGLALAEEMSNSNRSIHVLYYMAVEHYLSGRYENALFHLEEIRCDYGMVNIFKLSNKKVKLQ